MPTELPNITAELAERFNQQQRELENLQLQLKDGFDRQNDAQQAAELVLLQQQLAQQRSQLEEVHALHREEISRFEVELSSLRKTLLTAQQNERSAGDQLTELRRQADASRRQWGQDKQRLEAEIDDLKSRGQNRTPNQEAELRQQLKALEREITTLKLRPVGSAPPPSPPEHQLSAQELIRKLTELRNKLNTYSKRLANLRAFEMTLVTAQLTPEQLQDLVGALTKESTGMMERYQALSRWEQARHTDTQ